MRSPSSAAPNTASLPLRRTRVWALAAICAALACSDGTAAGPQPHHIVVSPPGITMDQLQTQQLTIAVFDVNDSLIPAPRLTFSSTAEAIATVSEEGVVTSVGAPGSADVIIRSGPAVATVAVTVRRTVGQIASVSSLTLPQLEIVPIQATVLDAIGTPIQGATVTLESQDPSLFTVEQGGYVRSTGRAGTGTLWLRHAPVSKPVTVTVTPVPREMHAITTRLVLPPSREARALVRVLDLTSDVIDDPPLAYQATAPAVATVSGSGLVRGEAIGSGAITVKLGTLEATIPLEVAAPTHPTGSDIREFVTLQETWAVAVGANGLAMIASPIRGVQRFDIETGDAVGIRDHRRLPTVVGFSADGARGYVGSQDQLDIIDFAKDTVVGILPYEDVLAIATSPDGRTLALGTGGTHLLLVDAATGVVRASAATGNVNAIAFTPTGTRLFATNAVGAPRVLEVDVATGDVRRIFQIDDAQGIAVAPDGTELYVAREKVPQILVIPLSGGATDTIHVAKPCFGLAQSPDGVQLWAVCEDAVRVIDRVSRTLQFAVAILPRGRRIAFTPDGRAAVVTSDAGRVYVIR